MIGVVDTRLQPLLPVAVVGADGAQRLVTAVLDTGYTGALTLPADLIASLGLAYLSGKQSRLADGSAIAHPTYEAKLNWDGVFRSVIVDQSESDPLVGMELLAGRRLVIDAEPGGLVEVGPIPPRPAAPLPEDPFP